MLRSRCQNAHLAMFSLLAFLHHCPAGCIWGAPMGSTRTGHALIKRLSKPPQARLSACRRNPTLPTRTMTSPSSVETVAWGATASVWLSGTRPFAAPARQVVARLTQCSSHSSSQYVSSGRGSTYALAVALQEFFQMLFMPIHTTPQSLHAWIKPI